MTHSVRCRIVGPINTGRSRSTKVATALYLTGMAIVAFWLACLVQLA